MKNATKYLVYLIAALVLIGATALAITYSQGGQLFKGQMMLDYDMSSSDSSSYVMTDTQPSTPAILPVEQCNCTEEINSLNNQINVLNSEINNVNVLLGLRIDELSNKLAKLTSDVDSSNAYFCDQLNTLEGKTGLAWLDNCYANTGVY